MEIIANLVLCVSLCLKVAAKFQTDKVHGVFWLCNFPIFSWQVKNLKGGLTCMKLLFSVWMSSECLLLISTPQFLFTNPEMLQSLRNWLCMLADPSKKLLWATVWCMGVLYAFRMPGVRRIPGMLFTGIKPVIRCMVQYLDQYTNHHLKTNGRTAFAVRTPGWAQLCDFFGNACLSVWIYNTVFFFSF